MTCVVGVTDGDMVVIGADSAAIEGDEITAGPPKVFRRGPYLIGYCESFRVGQVIQYRTRFTEQKCDDDLEHLATVFVDELRKSLHAAGALSTDSPEELHGPLLVGYRERLYIVDTDYAIHPVDNAAAIGVGAPYALGSLFTTAGDGAYGTADRAIAALRAAAVNCTAVAAPFTIITNKE